MKVMKRNTTALPAIYMKSQVLPNTEALIFSMHNPQSHTNTIVKISPILTVVTQLNMTYNITSSLACSNDLQAHCSTELYCPKKQRHETETLLAFKSTAALLNIPTTLFTPFVLFLLSNFQIWILASLY